MSVKGHSAQPWEQQAMFHPEELHPQHHPLAQPHEAYAQPAPPVEGKRERRRREMADRVSRLHDDTVARRDRVFHDLSEIFARTADELLPPPVFPTSDLTTPVSQLPPSLPFTDPVIPDMHPIPYLFSLHHLSMERSNQQVAIRLFQQHQVAAARRLYEAEVERIEDEYEAATKAVVERLFEGVEERKRRLAEEKEGEGVTIDTFLEATKQHGTRRKGGKGGGSSAAGGGSRVSAHQSGGSNGAASPSESVNGGVGGKDGSASTGGVDVATLGALLGLNSTSDPFNLAASLLPPSVTSLTGAGNALSALSGVGPTASLLTGTIGKRKSGGRTQPGLPPAHFLVQSGTYSQFGKSLAGLSALRGEEIDGDLGEMRRKRQRTGTGTRRGGY